MENVAIKCLTYTIAMFLYISHTPGKWWHHILWAHNIQLGMLNAWHFHTLGNVEIEVWFGCYTGTGNKQNMYL